MEASGNTLSESIFCPNCGERISARARFCPSCGARQEEFRVAPPESPADRLASRGSPKRRQPPRQNLRRTTPASGPRAARGAAATAAARDPAAGRSPGP